MQSSAAKIEMDPTDEKRLALIRTQNAMWRAVEPTAETWDTTFLLKLLDRATNEKTNNRRRRSR